MQPQELDNLPLVGALSAETRTAIAPLLEPVQVRAGEFVFHQGDPAGPLFLCTGGVAEAVVRTDDGEVLLSPLEAPTFFGGLGFVEGMPRSSDVRARTDLKLVAVPRRVLVILEERNPRELAEFYRQSFQSTAEHLRSANRIITAYFQDRLAKQQQEQLDKELRHLLVHDLRSPLAICLTGLSQLLDRPDRYGPLNDRQVKVLRRSRRSGLFLQRLVNEILEVGRSEVGRERLEETSLRDVLVEAIPQVLGGIDGPDPSQVEDLTDFESFRRALTREDLHVEAEPGALEQPIRVDKFRLVQVIMNLVGNALKHAPGWLAIRVARGGGDRLRVSVVDRGPGIPDSFRSQIFNIYRQVEAKQEGVQRGFGLGLAGAARLVEALGGSIAAGPGDGGTGTQITFDFPIDPGR